MTEDDYSTSEMTRLGMAGLARNVGYGSNKVFAADVLSALTPSKPLIGLVLGMEGLLGIILNPLSGWVSDRFPSRFGRRRLFILFSTPIAGILWIAFASSKLLHLAIIFLISFYFFQQLSPTPLQAWMPDIVREDRRARASGVLNLWWQTGNFLAFLPIPLLWKWIHGGAFWVVALIMIAGGLVTGLTVRESPDSTARTISRIPSPWLYPNLWKYFAAQFLWWLAFEGMASFFTLFVIHTLGGTVIDSALGMTFFTLAAMVVAMGFGRMRKPIASRTGLIVCLTGFGLISLFGTVIHSVTLAFVLLFVAGLFWGGIQVISYPWGTELLSEALGSEQDATPYYGMLYGLGNLTQSVGLLIAAPVTGLLIAWQHGSYSGMFWVNVIASAIAVGLLFTVSQQSAAPVTSTNPS